MGDANRVATPQAPRRLRQLTGRLTLSPAVRSVLKSAGTRFIALPMTALRGVICTRIVIENFGRDTYAQYGLLVGIGALLPFADMGMATAIMNAIGESEKPAEDPHVKRVLVTSIRVLCCSGAVIALASILITLLDAWPALLGESGAANRGGLGAAAVLLVMALTMPVAFGPRVLTGLNKNHITIGLLGLQTPIVLLVLLLVVRVGWTGLGPFLAVIPYAALLVLTVVSCILAARWVKPVVGQALRAVPRLRSERGARVMHVAWPTLVQMIALPIAMQSDRLVLSHVTDDIALADYNLAAQIYTPVWQVVTAGGVALWPVFARHRAAGVRADHSPVPLAYGFAAAAAVACMGITLASGWLAQISSGGEISIQLSMSLSFSLLMVLQAAKYPLGVYMTDAPGLRYQAFFIVFMIPVNLGLSVLLALQYGAIGPVIGSAIGVFVCQVLPNWLYVRHDLARARAAA